MKIRSKKDNFIIIKIKVIKGKFILGELNVSTILKSFGTSALLEHD